MARPLGRTLFGAEGHHWINAGRAGCGHRARDERRSDERDGDCGGRLEIEPSYPEIDWSAGTAKANVQRLLPHLSTYLGHCSVKETQR